MAKSIFFHPLQIFFSFIKTFKTIFPLKTIAFDKNKDFQAFFMNQKLNETKRKGCSCDAEN